MARKKSQDCKVAEFYARENLDMAENTNGSSAFYLLAKAAVYALLAIAAAIKELKD
jgi:hypothetical protein